MRRTFPAMLSALLIASVAFAALSPATASERNYLSVQLKWIDQAQFAGFYIAEQQQYYAREGVNVHLLSGTETDDPFDGIANARTDVVVASQRQAELAQQRGLDVVNIAQIFQENYMVLLCRRQPKMDSEADLAHATFAQSGPEFVSDITEYLDAVFPEGSSPKFVTQKPGISSVSSGEADCMLGSTFNEYWQLLDSQIPLLVFDPKNVGVNLVQDGLYVERSRLEESDFRQQLARLIIALRSGWEYAANNQESTVRLVLARNPALSYEVQTRQLESVLTLIDLRGSAFGYYDLAKYAQINSFGFPSMSGRLSPTLWTHSVYEIAHKNSKDSGLLTPTVKFYLNSMRETQWYHWFIYIGTVSAAVAGSVMGARRGYRLWGCFVLALASAIGGGVLRDIVIGGDRYPIWLTHKPTEIYLSFVGAAATEIVRRRRDSNKALALADNIANRADVVGFSILAIHGAAVAMCADLPAIWAPLAAALTVAGGGILSDILVAQEHVEFRTIPYEEQALAGSLVLVAGLWVANHFEYQPVVVAVTFGLTLLMLLTGRYNAIRSAVIKRRTANALPSI